MCFHKVKIAEKDDQIFAQSKAEGRGKRAEKPLLLPTESDVHLRAVSNIFKAVIYSSAQTRRKSMDTESRSQSYYSR